ncbi:unnamed protein product [Caenorhabditis auriculariae]|uniref:Uncharacterized protein n=1 Tax=Caenorhabditis auriculariae TaxID=2777116 RepID=A0A8S1H543_9PELO|nr:unnamed protein product [Caenorhabditis auriculariae]
MPLPHSNAKIDSTRKVSPTSSVLGILHKLLVVAGERLKDAPKVKLISRLSGKDKKILRHYVNGRIASNAVFFYKIPLVVTLYRPANEPSLN